MQGLTPVKEYTSAAEMRAGHAAARRRTMGVPPIKPLAQYRFAPKPEIKSRAWPQMTTEERCSLIKASWRKGETIKNCAARMSRDIGEPITRNMVIGMWSRYKAGPLHGIIFRDEGGNSCQPKYIKDSGIRVGDQSEIVALVLAAKAKRYVISATLIRSMCAALGYEEDDITGPSRKGNFVLARQKIMWTLKQVTKSSYPEIGSRFGGRDHTTVLHACRKIKAMIEAGDPLVADLKGVVSDD